MEKCLNIGVWFGPGSACKHLSLLFEEKDLKIA